jgi:MurNAc alpha-1-phosphate uridylyltransferase
MTTKRTLAIRPDPGARVPETAMVMAAGLGKRMRPLTATRPKPLVKVAGQTLIDHVFDRLRAAGVKRAVVNVHYLADAVEAHLKSHVKDMEVVISDERGQLMETGGGLVQARDLLGEAPFLVVNSDSLWLDGPTDAIRALAAAWDDARMDVLLLLVPLARANLHAGQGDFHLDAQGRITGRRKPGRMAPFVYSGIQIMAPRLIADWPEGPFSTMVFWERAIAAGRAYGLPHQGLWFDVGTPKAVKQVEAMLTDG